MFNHNAVVHKINQNFQEVNPYISFFNDIADILLERLDYIKLQPHTILDIGSGSGSDSKKLSSKYPDSTLVQLDSSLNMLKQSLPIKAGFLQRILGNNKSARVICADAMHLPLLAKQVDLVWSNMVLPYIDEFNKFFAEIHRVLKVNGTFLTSGLAANSLWQLREVGLNTQNFPDMRDIGDILVKQHFAGVVTDVDRVNIPFNTITELQACIKALGMGNALIDKPFKYFSKASYLNLEKNLRSLNKDGKLELSLEIFYAHGWKEQDLMQLDDDRKVIQFMPRNK